MNAQEKIESKSLQIGELKKQYGESNASPEQESSRRNIRRVKSGSTSMKQLNFKVNQNNFLKIPKDMQGGGFYKRSEIMGTSFPQIKTVTTNRLTENSKVKKPDESCQLGSIDSAEFLKQTLGPNHHCHFEGQVRQLVSKLVISESLAQRARDELDNVIWMVKNYNSEGLISRLLTLQQLKNDLEHDRQQMRQEIEILGLQRDDWQLRYQEINEKLLKMQGLENDLAEAKHKLDMSNETLEQINKRLREKQLEVQDWQRKCNTHDEQFKNRIANLDQSLKEYENQQQSYQKKIVKLENESVVSQNDIRQLKEKLEEEQRRSKQLHAELLDTRVNKVQNLQDEITKQKKIIQQRVEEIEEQERKIKQLNNKIMLLETQLKNYDEVTHQEKEELERSWQKKYKDLEKQSVQYKRDLNQLEIQLQQNDLLTQQKEQEVEQALTKVNEQQIELNKNKQQISDLKTENHRLNQEKEEMEQEINQFEQQNQDMIKERIEMQEQITAQTQELVNLKQQIEQLAKQSEMAKQDLIDNTKQMEKLREMLAQTGQQYMEQKQLYLEEQNITNQLKIQLQNKGKELDQMREDQQNQALKLQLELDEKNFEIDKLSVKLQESESNDKDLSQKFQNIQKQYEEQLNQNEQLTKQNQILKQQLELNNQSSEEIKQTQAQKDARIEELIQSIQKIKDDKSESNLLQKEIEKLTKQLSEQSDYEEVKQKFQQFEQIDTLKQQLEKENIELKQQVMDLETELDQWKQKFSRLEQEFNNYKVTTKKQIEDINQSQKTQFENLQQQNHAQGKKIIQLQEQLTEAQDKIEVLEEALQNNSGKDIKLQQKQEKHPLQKTNTFQQIFVEEKLLKDQEEEITLKFSDINFSKSQAHLTICFWIKIEQTNSKDQLPILRITTEGQKLLELGVFLETKQVYSTYIPNNHPKNKKKQNPITVTSQLSLKLGQFQLLALIMNESGQYMDMGLCLNGVRDDQVSISSTLLFPEAQLSFGKYSKLPFKLRDSIVITQDITFINIFKEVYAAFYQKYNQFNETRRRQRGDIFYPSAGDLIFYLLQQYENNPNKSKSKSKSPPHQQQAVYIKNRIVPAGLLSQYDLIARTQKTEEPTQEQEEIQEPIPWTRKLGVENLKKYLFQNFNYKGLLRPFIEFYDYLAIGLQLLQPSRENDTHIPTKFHKIIKPSIIDHTPYFVISFKQFINYLNYVGILRLNVEELKQICENMGVIYQIGKIDYIHYDHFLIIMRECVMNRAELSKKKKQEKGEPQPQPIQYKTINTYTEYIIESTGIEDQIIQNNINTIGIQELQILKQQDSQNFKLQIKNENDELSEQPLDYYHLEWNGILNLLDNQLLEVVFFENGNIFEIKNNNGTLQLMEQSENSVTLLQSVEIENRKIVQFELQEKLLRLILLKQEKVPIDSGIIDDDPDLELEMLELTQLPEGWNLGKFYVNINRCRECEKHASTTRHSEADFISFTEQISNLLKELFPNVEILENEDKISKLECFEVYIKNAMGPSRMVLLQKQESMTKFKESFEKKWPEMYEKLMQLINFHQSAEKLGQEQEKIRQN